MKIKVSQVSLNKALNIVSKVAAGVRTTLPILNNVLIRANDKKITLTTTNLELAAVSFVTGSVEQDGVITVPVKVLSEFVANLPKDGEITLEEKDHRVTIVSGQYRSVINGVVADEFPELPAINRKKAVVLRSGVDEFKRAVSNVVIASSNDTTRPVLTGVYIYTNNKNLYLVATDGYRLAEQKFISGVESEVGVIVPASTLQDVVRSMSPEAEEIEILIDEAQVGFRFEETEIISKLVDGSFPDYKQLIPKKTEIAVVVDHEELARDVKLAALFAREVGGSIVCETAKTELKISAVANELGENTSKIKVGEVAEGKVTVSSRFLLDVLNVIDEAEVRFGFSGKIAPIVVRGEKADDYLHIIMPMKS
jgi:DNA polymerase-3 subunit beta